MSDRTNFNASEHLGYAEGKGVKRISVFNNGVQINAAREETLQAILAASGGGFALVKRDYLGEDLIYKGTNTSATALDGDSTWSITKFTYVGGVETEAKTLTGSWTSRASLFS